MQAAWIAAAERSLFADILNACLAECRGNGTSIRLHLQAEDEAEVRALIDRIRQ